MAFAGRAYVEMGVTGQAAFKAAFAQMQLSVRQFQAGIQKIGGTAFRGVIGSLTTMRRMMGSLIGQATALGAAFGLSVGIKDAIDNASRLEETLNKFNVVFGDLADSQRKWSEDFADRVGRSQQQVLDFMASTQGMAVPLGINQDDAAAMSQTLTQLAFDVASFTNASDPEAFDALKKAILGETESLKGLDVILTDAAVSARMLADGIKPTEATEAQKAMTRYNMILENSKMMQGDVERSSFSFANQLKALQASWIDLSTAIGTAFLPYATVLLDYLRQLVSSLGLNATAADNTGKVPTTPARFSACWVRQPSTSPSRWISSFVVSTCFEVLWHSSLAWQQVPLTSLWGCSDCSPTTRSPVGCSAKISCARWTPSPQRFSRLPKRRWTKTAKS